MKFRVKKILTKSPLAAAGVFTSESINTEMYNRITGIAKSNQAGSLVIEQSDDGVTWHATKTLSVTADTVATYDEVLVSQFVRLKYTNGATAQTSFNLSGYANPW